MNQNITDGKRQKRKRIAKNFSVQNGFSGLQILELYIFQDSGRFFGLFVFCLFVCGAFFFGFSLIFFFL